ncbi:MAG: 16S rRNA processing protein RimM [Candidatus Puniceispirillum sp.]|nr:16S rRNA processing protein RimM [Candidatus Pelagibacter sp.]MBA4283713.1 16S rRNA processing protein RimM [Candidatus Puniceispirillum sp.]
MQLIKALRIQSAHGIHGYVNVLSYFEDKALLNRGTPLFEKDQKPFLKITKIKYLNKNSYHVLFEGLANRDMAEALKGTELFIPRDYLPKTNADEFYHEDLKECTIYNTNNEECGKVIAIYNYGAGDFFEIKLPNLQIATLPFNKDSVIEILIEDKKIIIDDTLLLY